MEAYKIIIGYLLLFTIGGVSGWVLEFFFRRIVHKQWVNPGFLNGPMLPLYGFGVMLLYFISDLPIDWWWKILLFLVVLTLLEYVAGIIFIKGMGIKLWDYSTRWGNIQGVICPIFSLAWCAIGTIFLFTLYHPFHSMFTWIDSNLAFSFFLGIAYGIFIVDLLISFHVSLRLREFAKKAKEILPYETVKSYIMNENKKIKARFRFVVPFKTKDLGGTIEKYFGELKEKASELLKKKDDKEDEGKDSPAK